MMTDPIADMLTRIRNAQRVGKTTVVLPSSKLKRAIADLLVREGWLRASVERPAPTHRGGTAVARELVLTLCYRDGGTPSITSVRRLSRPGRRVYITHGAIPTVKRGSGVVILSTSQGLLTNREARSRGIGGEAICEVF